MRITESRGSRTTTLFIAGKIDNHTSPQLQGELFRVSKLAKNVTLDFADVDSIDESGVRVLQSVLRLISSRRGMLLLQNANFKVRREVQKHGLGKLLVH